MGNRNVCAAICERGKGGTKGFLNSEQLLPVNGISGSVEITANHIDNFGWGLGEHDLHLLKRMQGSGIQRVAVSVFAAIRLTAIECIRLFRMFSEQSGWISLIVKAPVVGFTGLHSNKCQENPSNFASKFRFWEMRSDELI